MTKEQLQKLEADLWRAADNLRANSDLKASEYSTPVLGLIFLKFADNKFKQHEKAIHRDFLAFKDTRMEKSLADIAIEKCGFYLPDHARYDYLLNLEESKDIAGAIKEAMKAIEEYKPELQGVLPQDEYFRLTRSAQNKGIREGLSEDELELFDLLKKDSMTQDEMQKVKLAAKSLLQRLLDGQPKVLVQDWFKDSQTQRSVRSAVEQVLDSNLPESYDRVLFKEKCDNVFELVLDYASQGRKWAA